MCGIAGMVGAGVSPGEASSAVARMAAQMRRRGPDDDGVWSDPDGRLHLGFRRLAILDLTPAGHQPMLSGSGRSVLVFNGEVYNFQELRAELESAGVRFRSRSDSEVVLEALERWGIDALRRFNGMFGLAWYDLTERKLLLARDHAGIKPVHYALSPRGDLAFASEYDALLHAPWVDATALRPEVLRLYLRLHYIPAPYGLVAGTHQLEPGGWLTLDAAGRVATGRWWQLPAHPVADLRGDDARVAVRDAIERAVDRQRIADVPVGVFLSGGVDSPLVAAIARRRLGPGLRAFTIGTPGWEQDESADARRYAGILDVNHQVLEVSDAEAVAAVGDVLAAQPEPFADFSVVPTLLVSRLARSQVTVALSGDGGDELFFGYERPLSLLRNWPAFHLPHLARRALVRASRATGWPRVSGSIAARDPATYYYDVNCRLTRADIAALAPGLPPEPRDFDMFRFDEPLSFEALAAFSRRAEWQGQLQRCLKKVDMASMFHSLEVRVPLLDREVVDVALRIAPRDHMRGHARKAVLRDALEQYVPADAIPRPKRGFAVPLGTWLRGPLRSMAEEAFARPSWPGGLLDDGAVRRYWRDHVEGRRDNKWGLWTLLALHWWYDRTQSRQTRARAA